MKVTLLIIFSDLTHVLQTLGDTLSPPETLVFLQERKFWKIILCQELMNEADLDGDGNVNYEEFVTMIFKV